MRVSEIRVNQIRVNQGLGVYCVRFGGLEVCKVREGIEGTGL